MNMEQLKIACEIAEAGSITKASKKLFLSQPNLSIGLKNLEEELGFSIFIRTNSGISVTEQGGRFLIHAKAILAEMDKLMFIQYNKPIYRFRLSIILYSPMIEAFLQLCKEYDDIQEKDFTMYHESINNLAENMSFRKLDLAIFTCGREEYKSLTESAEKRRLTTQYLKRVPININVSINHPLIRNNDFEFSRLQDYTYVGYKAGSNSYDSQSQLFPLGMINPRHTIFVEERDTRCRIVSETTAFSIGFQLPQAIRQRYQLRSIPVPDYFMDLYYMARKNEETEPIIKRYIELLKKELDEAVKVNNK